MLTSMQLRAARVALRLTQAEVGALSGLTNLTIHKMESQEGEIRGITSNVRRIKTALEQRGIIFIEGGIVYRPVAPAQPIELDRAG